MRGGAKLVVVLVVCLLAIGGGSTVGAEGEEISIRDRELLGEPLGPPRSGEVLAAATEEVGSLMRCPQCQGLSVADSHTPSALAMRMKAEALLEAGYSREQVLSYFETSYGEFIRLAPRAEGFNLFVWFVPVGVLLLGLVLVWRRLRRGTAPPSEEPSDESDLDAYRRRVREEMNQ